MGFRICIIVSSYLTWNWMTSYVFMIWQKVHFFTFFFSSLFSKHDCGFSATFLVYPSGDDTIANLGCHGNFIHLKKKTRIEPAGLYWLFSNNLRNNTPKIKNFPKFTKNLFSWPDSWAVTFVWQKFSPFNALLGFN